MAVKTTSELLFEHVGETGDENLAAIANEVEYLETANSNLLHFVFQVHEASKELIERARVEMEKAYSPERFAAFEAEADAVIKGREQDSSIEALLQSLIDGGLVDEAVEE
jgi:hypothetical protein